MSRIRKQTKQSLRSFAEMIKSERLYPWMLALAMLFWLASIGLLLWRIVPLAQTTSFLPLHYNVYFGVDQFGPWYRVFVLPVLSFLFLGMSLIMQTRFFHREKMLARFFSVSTTVLLFVFLVATVLLVLLNL